MIRKDSFVRDEECVCVLYVCMWVYVLSIV